MYLHVKAKIEVKVRDADQPLDAPEDATLEVWSDGRPSSGIQLKVGKSLYCIEADELIDAVRRCSK